jgi:hypothetical protein
MKETRMKKLLNYKDQGYVFHGSPKSNIEIFVPRKAIDNDKENTFNNDTAVFATTYPEACIIFACLNKLEDKLDSIRFAVYLSDNGYIVTDIEKKLKPYLKNLYGYIYVLPKDTFVYENDNEGWQVKSKESIKPVDVIKVVFSDYSNLAGKINWV